MSIYEPGYAEKDLESVWVLEARTGKGAWGYEAAHRAQHIVERRRDDNARMVHGAEWRASEFVRAERLEAALALLRAAPKEHSFIQYEAWLLKRDNYLKSLKAKDDA